MEGPINLEELVGYHEDADTLAKKDTNLTPCQNIVLLPIFYILERLLGFCVDV